MLTEGRYIVINCNDLGFSNIDKLAIQISEKIIDSEKNATCARQQYSFIISKAAAMWKDFL